MTRTKPKRTSARYLTCPDCGKRVKIPIIWIMGVESIFICGGCKRRFRTGYKMGAVLFGLALTLAVATANLGAYLFSEASIPVMALLIIPLWIFYGYIFRQIWLVRVSGRKTGKKRTRKQER